MYCFDMHHTADLAAAFENLDHDDCVERLRTAYRMLGFSVDVQMSENEANVIIKDYIGLFVRGMSHSTFKLQGAPLMRYRLQGAPFMSLMLQGAPMLR